MSNRPAESFSLELALSELAASRAQTLALLAEIPAPHFHQPQSFGAWSLRDVLAHLIGWERITCDWLAGAAAIRHLSDDEVNEINARLIRETTAHSKAELLDEMQRMRERVVELLERLSELQGAEREVAIKRLYLDRWLPECTYAHEETHRRKIAAWWNETRGQTRGHGDAETRR